MGTGEKVKKAQVEQKKLFLYVVGHVAQKEGETMFGAGPHRSGSKRR